MNIKKLLLLVFAISSQLAFTQENNANNTFELAHTQVIPIKDTKANKNYELYIKLPEGYSENTDVAYPVIYYTDAIWHIEVLSAATEYMLKDVILVGISWQLDINEDLLKERGKHVSRFRDYSMKEHDNPEIQAKYQLGQASKHLEFIKNDVIKYVDNNYRTDPDSRTYFGYSLGGEFGAYILLTQPQTFDNYIIGSPSIKNEVPYLSELYSKFNASRTDKNNSLNANVFLSYGTLEEDAAKSIEDFYSLLRKRRDVGLAIHKEVIEGNHESGFPMTAIRSIAWLSTAIKDGSTFNTDEFASKTPLLNQAYINPTPEDRKDGLSVGELGKDGGDKAAILKLAREIAKSQDSIFDSFLIIHKDKLLFESYFRRGRSNVAHPQASATKAMTSLLLGRAIQLGYLSMDDLNKPVVSFLKELDSSKFPEGVEKITLNKALTMQGGLGIPEDKWKEFREDNSLTGQKIVQAVLEHSAPITPKSQEFKYGNFNPPFVMQVIEAVVPGTAEDFIKNELFDKLGITNYKWETEYGLPASGWRSSVTSRDMAKLGILVRNKGKWNGEQLIPEDYIAKATSRILLTGDDDVFGGGKDVSKQGYGYFFWNADLKHGNKSYYSASAQGGGGQYIVQIDELDLIVVATGHNNDGNGMLQIIAEHVLPGFVSINP
ncbi:serine hydrolase [Poritiphilus flavus]|uniref:Serine hydrolase n=1 Tax=Poritiphilus flavus TaxID=2697053 RepID=A0A6L9EG37_9FLAO|nr:serine hydrolase [Poritiphilus flavus]NAS13695.1 serine hydrolase [Poritiphilus flavus]